MNMVQQFDPAQVDYSQDLGTPGAESDVKVTVYIDGMPVSVPEGTSVMRAAAMVGANIPKLCATDNLNAFGSCRLCLVEIEGRPGTPASCSPGRPGNRVEPPAIVTARARSLPWRTNGISRLGLSTVKSSRPSARSWAAAAAAR